jgi:N6-L-threonylcarbamoyladenine synthase
MRILAIETSCDETAVAILDDAEVIANVISSQLIHQQFGGVVPELASREHLRLINKVMVAALRQAKCELNSVDLIAATAGPGLIGALLVGLTFAKGLALALARPFLAIHHMEGHIYSSMIAPAEIAPPLLAVVVSGGHTQLIHMPAHLDYKIIGNTHDDAVGEAFDKVAKMLGLPYPGGPAIDKLAEEGNADTFAFPIGRIRERPLDFSYSGLKTAVLTTYKSLSQAEKDSATADLCASFQKAAVRAITTRVAKAMQQHQLARLILVGGVAANRRLRSELSAMAAQAGWEISIPDFAYCMDNAAMIGRAALQRFRSGIVSANEVEAFAQMDLGDLGQLYHVSD